MTDSRSTPAPENAACPECGAKSAAHAVVSVCPKTHHAESVPLDPHAYGVETLWNRGGSSERWGMAMEMADVRQPLDRDDAEQLMAQMIGDGHAPDAVRLVAVTVVRTSPGTSTPGGDA